MSLLDLFKIKRTKTIDIPRNFINYENKDKPIPVLSSVEYAREDVGDKTILKISTGKELYVYTQLEKTDGWQGYDYATKVLINDKEYHFYFSEIPNKNDISGWNIRAIEKTAYECLKNKCQTNEPHTVIFLGRTPCFFNDEYIPHIVVALMNIINKLGDNKN